MVRFGALAAATLLALGGCVSPAYRISRAPKLFAAFPAAAQEKIKRGEVAEGFTREMVLMAVGNPERKYVRATSSGTFEVWAYVVDDQRAPQGSGKRIGMEGGVFIYPDFYFGVEYLRVGFDRDKAVFIERIPKVPPAESSCRVEPKIKIVRAAGAGLRHRGQRRQRRGAEDRVFVALLG